MPEKPPLGLEPRWSVDEKRWVHVRAAIQRYAASGIAILPELLQYRAHREEENVGMEQQQEGRSMRREPAPAEPPALDPTTEELTQKIRDGFCKVKALPSWTLSVAEALRRLTECEAKLKTATVCDCGARLQGVCTGNCERDD